MYFALQDFAACPGWGGGDPFPDPPWVQKGLVTNIGQLKPAFAVVSSIYHSTAQIGPAPSARTRPSSRGPRRRATAGARVTRTPERPPEYGGGV